MSAWTIKSQCVLVLGPGGGALHWVISWDAVLENILLKLTSQRRVSHILFTTGQWRVSYNPMPLGYLETSRLGVSLADLPLFLGWSEGRARNQGQIGCFSAIWREREYPSVKSAELKNKCKIGCWTEKSAAGVNKYGSRLLKWKTGCWSEQQQQCRSVSPFYSDFSHESIRTRPIWPDRLRSVASVTYPTFAISLWSGYA